MANSITASTVSPFSGLYLSDNNYNVTTNFPSASATGNSTAFNFANIDYPTVGKIIIQLSNTALTNTAGSMTNYIGLQESSDNSTWNNIAVFTSSLLPITDGGSNSSPAGQVQVLLTPQAKQYLRAQATVQTLGATAGGITGSYNLKALFAA